MRVLVRGRAWVAGALVALVVLVSHIAPARAQAKPHKSVGSRVVDYFDPRTPDREAAQKLAPVSLGQMAPRRPTGEGRVLRVRVYADDDYRASTLRWQKKVERQLDRVNRVVEPIFNVRFEVESLRKWPRSHAGLELDPLLSELEQLDAGDDVDWVVGFATAFRGVATSIHQIARAQLAAKHFVMRGMDDQEEGRAFARSFPMMPEGERESLYEERKAHKEVVIFLHEWGHTLGALHAEAETLIMNPAYDPRQVGFSDFEAQCISLSLDRRLADRAKPYPESAELLALVKKAPPGEGTSAERAELLALLAARTGGRGGSVDAPGRRTLPIPEADIATYNAAVAALDADRADDAWAKAAPLFSKHARQPGVLGLACSMAAGHAKAADAAAVCEAAMKLAPKDATLPLAAATSHVRAQAPRAAAPLLEVALARLLGDGAKPEDAALVRVARLGLAAGALSTAQDALDHVSPGAQQGDDARKIAAELEAQRRRVGLPRDIGLSGVTPQSEPEYFEGYWALAHERGAGATWQARFVEFERRFPSSPGTKILACEHELASRRAPAAAKLCQNALATYPEAVRAHYLMGVIASNARRDAEAEKSYRRAVLLDPDDPLLWRELASFYKARRASQKLEQLGQQHQALLSTPLPK